MTDKNPIALKRDCAAIMIPSGEKLTLAAGTNVWLTQALGSSFTVMTDHGHMVRIDGADAEVLGLSMAADLASIPGGAAPSGDSVEERVWNQLRSCFDPEIPVNIVDLGLIYDCRAEALESGGHKATVRFTLTAQGCGMGEFLKEDIRKKLLAVPGVREADVDLVWDPPWNQSMISAEAKLQLGIE
ncbi:MAG TPA: putative Fe-S cluster assembly protein SufT [Candidatus Binatia bacterium]|jgi:probable FeS assembly SUF system protein SufT|nr:putative Fe-S cluster assembly protein SufT [Candidatus Binatia bacterium]